MSEWWSGGDGGPRHRKTRPFKTIVNWALMLPWEWIVMVLLVVYVTLVAIRAT